MTRQSILYRALLIVGLVLIAVIYLVPTFVTDLPAFWKSYLPSQRIHLGLDLQGGTHLVMTVDVNKAIENALDRDIEELKREAAEAKVPIDAAARKDMQIEVTLGASTDRNQFTDFMKEHFPNLAIENSSTQDGRATFQLGINKREEKRLRDFALEQSLETIRNRIDQFGVSEPIIQREGDQDIVIQLPGIQDAQRAKDLIGRTALLEFKLLSDLPDADSYTTGDKPLPPGTQILNGADVDTSSGSVRGHRAKYLVQSQTLMTGDTIADALVRPATQMEGPYVALEFNARGAKQFDDLTGRSVGKRLAIVLDNTVYSAPVIRERISGGRASITGNFDIKEARDLAIVLRAGALPAPVHVAEERTVGPSLGQDSIRQGLRSFIVGGSLVVAAGRPDRNGAVRLVTLDPVTLVVRQEGKDNLVPTTYLAASDPSVYAVIDSGQGAYLGRFDASAVLQAQSERKVDAATDIVVSGTEVYVQDDAGNILILNKDDLKEKKRTG